MATYQHFLTVLLLCFRAETTTATDMNEVYVFIDGIPNYDWYYNRTDNTVYFTVVPTGNQLVEIAYPYAPRIIDPETIPELPNN